MKFKEAIHIEEIAKLIGIENIKGDSFISATGINEIHKVEKGDISFVDNSKYYAKCLRSAATIIIINQEVDCPEGKALLITNDPFSAYNKIVNHFSPYQSSNKLISDSAKIGTGTIVQPGVFIGNNVAIGKNCLLHPHVTIYDNTIIGDNVIIHANTVIGADAFYYKRRPEGYDKLLSCGRVIIQNKVEIGAASTIDKGVSGDTIIGEGTKIDNKVHIGHGVVVGKNCLFAAQVGIGGKTIIEDNVILWGQVGISKDLTIGANAVILAQSGVSKSLEGNKVYFGSPAEEARGKYKELALMRRLPEIMEKG